MLYDEAARLTLLLRITNVPGAVAFNIASEGKTCIASQ